MYYNACCDRTLLCNKKAASGRFFIFMDTVQCTCTASIHAAIL